MGTRLAGAAVVLLLLASCDAVCGPIPVASVKHRIACVDVKAPHHAYVVVQHASGAWIEQCVGFAPGFVDGPTLMDRSGIPYDMRQALVCRIDGEPAASASCLQQNPKRWALFIDSGGRWSPSREGFSTIQVTDKQAIGWHYVRAADTAPMPPPLPHQLDS